MGKDRISATVDPGVAEYLDQDHVNASGLVNKLVKEEMNGGGAVSVEMVELRLEQVRSERREMEGRLENKCREEERLETRLKELRDDTKEKLSEARDVLEPEMLDPDNPAVQNWAEKCGFSPEELIDELEGDL